MIEDFFDFFYFPEEVKDFLIVQHNLRLKYGLKGLDILEGILKVKTIPTLPSISKIDLLG
jgi:hypothetical protein